MQLAVHGGAASLCQQSHQLPSAWVFALQHPWLDFLKNEVIKPNVMHPDAPICRTLDLHKDGYLLVQYCNSNNVRGVSQTVAYRLQHSVCHCATVVNGLLYMYMYQPAIVPRLADVETTVVYSCT